MHRISRAPELSATRSRVYGRTIFFLWRLLRLPPYEFRRPRPHRPINSARYRRDGGATETDARYRRDGGATFSRSTAPVTAETAALQSVEPSRFPVTAETAALQGVELARFLDQPGDTPLLVTAERATLEDLDRVAHVILVLLVVRLEARRAPHD